MDFKHQIKYQIYWISTSPPLFAKLKDTLANILSVE